MVILKQYETELLLCTSESFIVYNTVTCEEVISKVEYPNQQISAKKVQDNENRAISTACYSKNGEFVAISAGKQLSVYKRDLSIVKTFILQRAVSKIRFTANNDILVGDKTGDAYLCTLTSSEDEPRLLLGHLSMLLDILTHEKFIVTCDRDEKIRVSCYPNAYNIMSYCLGHKQFVTNIEVIDNYLVSASGDGTIRFWNFLSGEQLSVINTNDYIKDKELIDSFCKEMDEEKCEVSSLPVKDMQVFQSEECAYVAVLLHNYINIQIYIVRIIDERIDWNFLCNIVVNSIPLCFSFSDHLYVLSKENLTLYCLKNGKFVEEKSEKLVNFFNKHKDLFIQSTDSISVLYKRKFDNVQEYLERKKQRLEGKINV